MVFKSKFPDVTPDARYGDLVSNFFWCQLDAHGARELFLDHASGRRWTGAQIKQTSARLAARLAEAGLRPEADCVVFYKHCDYAQLAALAILFAGGSVCAGYPLDPEHEHEYMLEVVRPSFVFVARELLAETLRLRQAAKSHFTIVIMDDEQLAEPDRASLAPAGDSSLLCLHRDLLDREPARELAAPVQVDPHRPAFILLTSGSTGRPKPVVRSQRNSLYVCHSLVGAAELWDLNERSVVAAHLALDHGTGIFLLKQCLAAGYKSVILDGYEPAAMLAAIEAYRITDLVLGSALVHNLLVSPLVGAGLAAAASEQQVARLAEQLGSLRNLIPVGSSIASQPVVGAFMRRFPNCSVRQAFGMTECGFQCIVPRELALRDHSLEPAVVGLALPNVEMRLVDRQPGGDPAAALEIAEPDRPGELYVRGPTVSPGYLGAQFREQARDSFRPDGFYKSSDFCSLGADGMLRVFGRFSEVLCLGDGWKVLPNEIERVIMEHPLVEEAAVVGVPSASLPTCHAPRAYVVARPAEPALSEAQVRQFVAERLSEPKHLHGGVKFVAELPRVSIGKVDKLALKRADGY